MNLQFGCLLTTLVTVIFFSACEASAVDQTQSNAHPVVAMKTSLGMIKIELNADKAPITVKNFLRYVDDKFYDGTVFHRVIDGFMIQGGGFEAAGGALRQKRTRAPIKNEAANGLKNDRGTIAMARTADPNSATAQFFINVSDNKFLNRPQPDGHGYAVFGKVIEGMEVVDKIRRVKTGAGTLVGRTPDGRAVPQSAPGDVPLKNVVIESIRRVKPAKDSSQ